MKNDKFVEIQGKTEYYSFQVFYVPLKILFKKIYLREDEDSSGFYKGRVIEEMKAFVKNRPLIFSHTVKQTVAAVVACQP